MRILLAKKYQTANFAFKAYPIFKKNCDFINKKDDEMHAYNGWNGFTNLFLLPN